MPRPRTVRIPPYHWPGRLHRRRVRARPGSVLILVVAVLVLLALIATAWLVTVRIDRQAVARNSDNTEFDLLVEGVVNAESAALVRRVIGPDGRFRPDGYPHVDGIGAIPSAQEFADETDPLVRGRMLERARLVDPNIADRLPAAASNDGPYYWPRISASPFGTNAGGQFESPRGGDSSYDVRTNVAPTYVMLPTGPGGNKAFPGLKLPDGRVVLAADADGDGIADAGLFRLPVGQSNGLTYYGAVRVLDNGSALNANVATKPFSGADATDFPAAVPGNLYPTNISLYDLLQNPDAELQRILAYRHAGVSDQGLSLRDAWLMFAGGGAYGDGGAGVRPDMAFTSPYDAMYAQLAARLRNPGLHGAPAGGDGPFPYRAFALSDSLALAFHFCLADRDASLSPLEACLMVSTRSAFSVRSPYRPDDVMNWFKEQFNYDGGGPASLRPLLVTRNPVSTYAPDRYFDRGSGYVPSQAYFVGDRLYDPGTRRSFVCIRDIPAAQKSTDTGIPPDLVRYDPKQAANDPNPPLPKTRSPAFWAVQPWTSHPTKINVNTANFGQLFGAFWSVMGGAPYVGNRLPSPSQDVVDSANANLRQFKSFVRTVDLTRNVRAIVPLTGRQVRQLRAALAAVNTMDLRDADNTVTSRTITLTGSNGAPQYSVDVFGAEKQPYISEVFIDWDPRTFKTYIAIELYNPHAVPISLAGMKLVRCGRDTVPPFLSEAADLSALGSIGPGERVLVENPGKDHRPDDVTAEIPANTRRIDGNGLTLVVTPFRFFQHVQRDLYLMRPRSQTGGRAMSITEWDFYDETATNPTTGLLNFSNFVPIDQIDLTHVIVAPPADQVTDPKNRFRWRYARGTNPSADPRDSTAWQCVYPGPYRYPTPPGFGTFAEWIIYNQWPASDANKDPFLAPGLGRPKIRPSDIGGSEGKPWCTFVRFQRPLQVAAIDAAGPNAGSGLAPYGGFARNGDILQVPFIGSYTIRAFDPPPPPPGWNRPYPPPRYDFLDMVSLPLDSVYAEDGDLRANSGLLDGSTTFDPSKNPYDLPPNPPPGDDFVIAPDPQFDRPDHTRTLPLENIGRFAPLFYPVGIHPWVKYAYFDDFAPLTDDPNLFIRDQLGRTFSTYWRYHFALDLLDYLDVRSPQDDYLPNVDPGDPYSGRADGSIAGQPPAPVNNGPGTLASNANDGREDAAGEEGKVNINTAPWPVLAAVPMVTNPDGSIRWPENRELAKAIVHYRDVADESGRPHGPFRSLFELLKVPGFQTSIHGANDKADPYEVELDDADGDFSPYNRNPAIGSAGPETDGLDHVFSDFKAQNLALTRISNLLTTRSDSFTVYVLVQAWRDAGTDHPELVGQRRVAFVADRTSVHPIAPQGPAPSTYRTPMNIVVVPNN